MTVPVVAKELSFELSDVMDTAVICCQVRIVYGMLQLPSTSESVIVFVALQEVLLPVTVDAVTPPKVTVGGIFSEEVKLSVTVSSVVAKDGFELLDVMDTRASVGAV